MKKLMLKSLMLTAVVCLLSTPAWSAKISVDGKDHGELNLFLKGLHVLDARHNGYDCNDGTATMINLKYVTPSWHKLKVGLGYSSTSDFLNYTDFETERVSHGMFLTEDGSEKSILGELYVNYEREKFSMDVGRQAYRTPLTTIKYSMTPNYYSVYRASTTAIPGVSLEVAQITAIAFGARSLTDFALIGEGTGTAGSAINTRTLGQAEFHQISDAIVGDGAQNTNGISVLGATFSKSKKLKFQVWDYYVDEIVNNIYSQLDVMIPMKGLKLKLSAQHLDQREKGDQLAGNREFHLYGAKVTLAGKGWAVFGAMNESGGDTAMLNAWGGDPAYTSQIFSRNEYREDVTAIKYGLKYKILKNLIFMASHADYGKSETMAPIKVIKAGSSGMASPRTDAREMDLVLVYKPVKHWMFKVFYADRTSEYDGTNGKHLDQAHTRAVATYTW